MTVTQSKYAEKINDKLRDLGIHLSQHPFGYAAIPGEEFSFFAQEKEVAIRMGHEIDAELVDAPQVLLALKEKVCGDVCIAHDSTTENSLWDVIQNCGLSL